MNKINLLHISIVLLIVLTSVFAIYQYKSCMPQKIEILEDIEVKELPKEDSTIQEINNKLKKAICMIPAEELPSEEYYNYVSGKGIGKKVNFSILLKINENYFEMKTLQGDTQSGKISLVSCIKNKYLKDNFEILLYNKETQEIYKYMGEVNENN